MNSLFRNQPQKTVMEYQEFIRVARVSMLHVSCQRAKQTRSLVRNMLARATILRDYGSSPVAGLGEGARSPVPRPPLFLEKNEARGAEKNFLRPGPPSPQSLDAPLPSEGLDPPLQSNNISFCWFLAAILVSSGSADKSACSTIKLQKFVLNMKKKKSHSGPESWRDFWHILSSFISQFLDLIQ